MSWAQVIDTRAIRHTVRPGHLSIRVIPGVETYMAGEAVFGVHAFDPQQPLTPTLGCTRGHNEDVTNLGNAITNFQQANPTVVIPYVRE